MSGAPDPAYVQARAVLLDALDALRTHLDAVVLVGAQAIYLHTGEGEFAVAPFTTDADLSLSPDDLEDEPLLEQLLSSAHFARDEQPGRWIGRGGVCVDVMVAEGLAGAGTRSADIAPHAKNTARRAVGLEGTLVDRQRRLIDSLDPTDERSATVWVAGPGALLVAKVHKIYERSDASERSDRIKDKDVLDVLRLLQAVPTSRVAASRCCGEPSSSRARRTRPRRRSSS